MHPCGTALVGLFFLCLTLANENEYLTSFAGVYDAGDFRADLPADVPFWWMNNKSPFKRENHGIGGGSFVQHTTGCSNNGCSAAAVNLDLSGNPFLNGNGLTSAGASNYVTQATIQQSIDLTNNPFLSRGATPSGFVSQSQFVSTSGPNSIDYSGNPFLNAGSPTGSLNGYLPPKTVTLIPCTGQGQVCVPRQACSNGYILSTNVRGVGGGQQCNPDSETCCTVQVPPTPPPTRPPPPPTRPPTPPPTRPPPPPPPQTIPCTDRDYYCVAPQSCKNGVITSSLSNLQSTQKCYAPEVCCRFVQQTSPSATINTNLPPFPRLPINEIQDSTVLTDQGYVLKVPPNPYEPQPGSLRPVIVPIPPSPTPPPYVPPPTQPPYVPPPTQPPYVPPPTQPPYVPPPTQPPYRPPVTRQPIPTTPEYIPPPVTQKPQPPPFKGDGYIPPQIGSSSNDRLPNYLPPDVGESILPVPIIPGSPSENINSVILPPVGCPAAMNCTEIQYCSATGVISKTPVSLTRDQEIFRVPLTDCRDVVKGFTGKCCRDPDYVDPWPVGQLGQYNAEILGFDTGAYKPDKRRNGQPPIRGQAILSQGIPPRGVVTQTSPVLIPQQTNQVPSNYIAVATEGCGVRNFNSAPRGAGPLDTGFGEFPWQAMVLLESTKSLLCGGAIIDDRTVVTAAHCVNGLNPRDVLIKAGEWRLGSDEEPKPFQIVRVKTVNFHPAYNPTNLNADVALLHLEEQIRYDKHIGPICLEDEYSGSASSQDCVTTGWGKEVLRIHIQNALMHSVPVSLLPQKDCQSALSGYGFNPDTAVCGRPSADACEADAGSALACSTSTGKYVLKGVYSTETECASPSQLVTFTKLDINWIKAAMKSPGPQRPQPQPQPQPQVIQTVYTKQPQVISPPPTEYLPQPNIPQETRVQLSTQGPQYLPPNKK